MLWGAVAGAPLHFSFLALIFSGTPSCCSGPFWPLGFFPILGVAVVFSAAVAALAYLPRRRGSSRPYLPFSGKGICITASIAAVKQLAQRAARRRFASTQIQMAGVCRRRGSNPRPTVGSSFIPRTIPLDQGLRSFYSYFYIKTSDVFSPFLQVQYGGRVTDDFDKRLLCTFTNVWFSDSLLHPGFKFYGERKKVKRI